MTAVPVLLFDADCGFCSRSAAAMRRLDLRARIEPMQAVDLAALGVDAERARSEIPYVDANGVRYGADAIAAALGTGPFPSRLLVPCSEHRSCVGSPERSTGSSPPTGTGYPAARPSAGSEGPDAAPGA